MGAIGGMLGLSGGAAGTGFAAPTGTNILQPTTSAQAGQAYTGNQQALQQQQQLLQALGQQNGLQNQSNVFNQMQGVANGTGPNPAQAQLAQATGQNVAQQAALMAGQRGAGSNVGLMARQAAQQGSNAQQQAAGQAATLQANQSLNALNNMGNIANTQASNLIGAQQNYTGAQQNEQANLLNAIAGQNNANVGMQSNINSANASLANTQMGNQGKVLGGIMSSIGSAGGMMGGGQAEGGLIGYDDGGDVQPTQVQVSSPQVAAAPNPVAPASSGGGGGGGMASMLPMLAMLAANGMDTMPMGGQGSLPDFTLGTPITQYVPQTSSPQSMFGKHITQVNSGSIQKDNTSTQGQQGDLYQGAKDFGAGAQQAIGSLFEAKGGMVPAMVSPGEKILSPSEVEQVKKGADPMKVGKTVGGKPKVGGAVNSYSNDTVPKKLAVGSIVVPRSETKSEKPSRNSKDFVQKTLAKRRVK